MRKEVLQSILIIFLILLVILNEFTTKPEWLNNFFKYLNIIYGLLICFVGGYLLFRSVKPKMEKNEVIQDDLKDIRKQWDWDGTKEEPPIDYVYYYACKFERYRIYTKIGLFIVGVIIICFGVGLILEHIWFSFS